MVAGTLQFKMLKVYTIREASQAIFARESADCFDVWPSKLAANPGFSGRQEVGNRSRGTLRMRRIERVEHQRIAVGTQPGGLALGQLPRREQRAAAAFVEIEFAVEMLPDLAITDRTHRWQVCMQVCARAQGTHFIDESLREHRIEALRDALMQQRTIRGNQRELEHAPAK